MRQLVLVAVTLVAAAPIGSAAGSDLVLWDDGPGREWDVAYAVGNGRLGAMPFGAFPSERILLNEETIWSRTEPMLMPEDSFEHLETVRKLEATGDYVGADRDFVEHLQNERDPDGYQLAGWVGLKYIGAGLLRSTRRELDLETGVARSVHRLEDGSTIEQRVFASAPDDVIVVGVSAERPIGLRVSLDGAAVEGGDILLDGAATGDGATRYRVRSRVITDGKAQAAEGTIEVAAAEEFTILVSIAADLSRSEAGTKLPHGWRREALEDLDRVADRPIRIPMGRVGVQRFELYRYR